MYGQNDGVIVFENQYIHTKFIYFTNYSSLF